MNGAGGYAKRRSARLSAEGAEGNEAPMKKTRVQGAQSSTSAVSTKGQDEDSGVASRKKRKGEFCALFSDAVIEGLVVACATADWLFNAFDCLV